MRRAVADGAKEWLSRAGQLASIGLAFKQPLVAVASHVVMLGLWAVPDQRIEAELAG